MSTTTADAGWYPDPHGPGQRYWDGGAWTHHVALPDVASPAGVTVTRELVADRAPVREAVAMAGLGAAAAIGVFLPWIEVYGRSTSLADASGGVAFAVVAAGGFLAYLGVTARSTGRMRWSGWACAALVLTVLAAGASLPSDEQLRQAGVDPSSVGYGIGAMLTLLGSLAAIWPLVVLWRHQRKIAAIGAVAPTRAAATPATPAAATTPATGQVVSF